MKADTSFDARTYNCENMHRQLMVCREGDSLSLLFINSLNASQERYLLSEYDMIMLAECLSLMIPERNRIGDALSFRVSENGEAVSLMLSINGAGSCAPKVVIAVKDNASLQYLTSRIFPLWVGFEIGKTLRQWWPERFDAAV